MECLYQNSFTSISHFRKYLIHIANTLYSWKPEGNMTSLCALSTFSE